MDVLSPLESQGRISNELAKQTSNFATLTQNFPVGTGSAAVTHFTIEPKGSVVRVGVNYLFNWGAPAPVVAKY